MSEREKYKRAIKGDIAYNMMRMWQGAVGVAPEDGLISPAYVVARSLAGTDSRYFAHLFRTGAYMNEVNKYSHGIVTDRNRLYWDEFKQMPSPFPPPEEQKAIADYLDRKALEIHEFIHNKRRLVALLNERKLALVNEAVTRGIDPCVKFKPSGIDWLGEIPETWEVMTLKRVVSFNPSKSETRANPADEENVVFLPMENISVNGQIDCTDKRPLSQIWNGFTYFRRGDVIVAKITPCFENGKGAFLERLETNFGFGTTELIVLRPSEAIDGAFLRFLTSTKQFLLLGEQFMTGAAGQQRIPSDFVKNYPIALPKIDEQLEILEHIQKKSAEIDQTINRAEREIELIEEYHTTLICDAVFGQLDIRHLAKPEKRRKPNVHFCRSVLAAEIVDRHRDTLRFGWIKLQKAILLVERHLELEEIQSRPVRAAAGPFDNAMMRSVHAQMKRSKWFNPQRQESGGIEYLPMEKCGAHRNYFDQYWGNRKTSFDRLMELIHPMKTEQIEIVATLYAAWNDFLIQGETVDDDRLVDEVLNRWDASKKRISEDRWRAAIDWMREKNLVPKGYGRATERAQDGDC
jgi:type I restriction enzyme S subunit